MPDRSESKPDKKLAEGRTQRHALLLIWAIIGTIGVLFILYGQYKLRQARASAAWTVVAGKIITSDVTAHTDEEGTTYSAQIEYVYTAKGTEHRSNVVVIGGHEYGAHGVVARYPLGAKVSVAYDPAKPSRAVLEPGVESYWSQKWGISILLGALFMATLFNFILRRAMNEERSLMDHVLIITFKVIFFPVIACKGNLTVMGIMLGAAAWLMMLELNFVLTGGLAIFVAFYGVIWVLMLWIRFMGWLSSLTDKS